MLRESALAERDQARPSFRRSIVPKIPKPLPRTNRAEGSLTGVPMSSGLKSPPSSSVPQGPPPQSKPFPEGPDPKEIIPPAFVIAEVKYKSTNGSKPGFFAKSTWVGKLDVTNKLATKSRGPSGPVTMSEKLTRLREESVIK